MQTSAKRKQIIIKFLFFPVVPFLSCGLHPRLKIFERKQTYIYFLRFYYHFHHFYI